MLSATIDLLQEVLRRAHPVRHNDEAAPECDVCRAQAALADHVKGARQRVEVAMEHLEQGIAHGLARDGWVRIRDVEPAGAGYDHDATARGRREFAKERARNIAVALIETFEPELND